MQTINYFISENYIPHWTPDDAYRELFQNFIDYGEYDVNITTEENIDNIILSNNFNPDSTDLLIIGESNKGTNQIGKYGEGLKMAALVLLRHDCSMTIYSTKFTAKFRLIDNDTTTVRTLGVDISDPVDSLQIDTFNINIKTPKDEFKRYQDSIIKPIDIIHTREGFGSIVNKPKGSLYVGNLFVCAIPKLNYAYDLLPKRISLDRDRKVPKDFDVKWSISKIQETYEAFDPIGKSADVVFSNIPEDRHKNYTPKILGNNIVFTVPTIQENGEVTEVVVSDNYREQLLNSNLFSKAVFKLKSIITSALKIDELAIKFKSQYLHTTDSKQAFDILMLRFGITMPKDSNLPF